MDYRRRRTSERGRTCARIRFGGKPRAKISGHAPDYTAVAEKDGSVVGLLEAYRRDRDVPGGKRLLAVEWIVVDEAYAGCGIATKLYTMAAEHACQKGLRLASDTARTDNSEGFWRKQERRGRAECILEPNLDAERLNSKMRPVGTWPCGRWVLRRCPTMSQKLNLDGTRRRR